MLSVPKDYRTDELRPGMVFLSGGMLPMTWFVVGVVPQGADEIFLTYIFCAISDNVNIVETIPACSKETFFDNKFSRIA